MAETSLQDLARLVTEARVERGWTVEEAARRAQLNRVTWKRIEEGLPVRIVNRSKATRLLGIGTDAVPQDRGQSAADIASEALNPDLADFTDHQLLHEIEARMVVMAAELHASGKRGLRIAIDPDGTRHIISSFKRE